MAQAIKIHKVTGLDGQEETTELNFQEAKKLVENCYKWNCCVFDTKTRELVREINPNVDEITIILIAAGGG